jgi:hypothetical protein
VSFGNGTDNFEFFVLLAQRAASITIKIFQPSDPRMIAIIVGNARRTRVCHIKKSMSHETEAKIRPLRGWRLYIWPVPETKRLNTAASVALFRGDAGLGAACAVVAGEDSGIGENSATSKPQNSRVIVLEDSVCTVAIEVQKSPLLVGAVGIEIASLLSKSNKGNDVAPPPHSNWSLLEATPAKLSALSVSDLC